MTDETPQPEGEPSPAAPQEAPTAETKAFTYDDAIAQEGAHTGDEDDVAPAEAPTQAAPVAAPVAAAPVAAAPATPERPAGIFVPKWVGLVAAAIVAALIFGGIGYAIGDSSSDSTTQNASSAFPNGNGDGTTTSNAGFLGVGVQTSTNPKGVEITDVADGSPAAKAGLQKGDVVTAIDGNDIGTAEALRSAVQAKQSGDEISVTYSRNGQSNTVKVTLTSRSEAQSN